MKYLSWYQWAIASTLSVVIGGPAITVLMLIPFTVYWRFEYIWYALYGFLLGAILGASQAFCLWDYRYPVVRWVALSALGLAVGMPAAFLIYYHLTNSGYVAASVIGLALGVAQTAGFPDYSPTHLIWIPVSIVGVIGAYYFSYDLVGHLAGPVTSLGIGVLFLCEFAMVTTPVYGLITGLAIQWITRGAKSGRSSP